MIEAHIPELLIRFSFPLFNESSASLLAWPGGRNLHASSALFSHYFVFVFSLSKRLWIQDRSE